MRVKHLFSAFCIAAGLAFAAPALSSPFGTANTVMTVQAAEGWNQDAGGTYYVQGGTKLLGLQQIGTSTYYFNANGYRTTGSVRIGDATYFFRPDTGALCTGVTGLAQIGDDSSVYYYFSSTGNGSIATSQWVVQNGKYFYADENGQIKLGTIKVGSKLYHITPNGRMTGFGKSSYDNNYYYAGARGVLKTGLKKIGGKLYYFNPLTGMRQTGSVTVNGYSYFFNKKTGVARTGWVSQKDSLGVKKYYYYNTSGRRLSGFLTINGKKYYLNPDDNDARAIGGWYKIGQHFYCFSDKGVLQSGFVTVNGKTYYCSASGVRMKGWQTVNGYKYFMNKKTAVMRTGWFNYNGNKYYLNPVKTSSTYGAAKTGWVKIKNAWYYFNTDCTMRTGWLLDNMKYYYFDKETGKMVTGQRTIDGTLYNFGTSGGITANITGEWKVAVNRKKCFVVVYRGSTPIKAFVCSTARDGVSTPTGTFRIMDKLRWHELMGPSWGQYCSHITSDILFHSVPNSRPYDNHSLNASAFNMLGSPASAGCIRLTVKHAKWLYDNVPVGTTVVVSDSIAVPANVVIEQAPKIPLTQNYDPTDPNV